MIGFSDQFRGALGRLRHYKGRTPRRSWAQWALCLLVGVSLVGLSACTTLDQNSGDPGLEDQWQQIAGDNGILWDGQGGDAQSRDVGLDYSDAGSLDGLAPPCEDEEGCFGAPCETNEDCASGLCISHMGNLQCTEPCLEDCPQGWNCKQIQLSGTDLIFACVSDFVHLCQPCRTKADCVFGEIQDVCVDYGPEAAFCGASCEDQGDCPMGFECADVVATDGGTSLQCVNVEGVCECSESAIKSGLTTRCSRSNMHGICAGERSCAADGLQECDAPEPREEVCNGADDNCDGSIDEAPCDDGNPCTEDICNGSEGCSFEPTPGVPCDDGKMDTKNDLCDNQGSCVGETFVCGTGPCVLSVTPNGKTCDVEYKVAGSGCDDGKASTRDDACTIEGLCKGDEYSCEAGECALSSVPDGVDCVVTYKDSGDSCDDKDLTTKNDVCDGQGTCEGTDYVCVPSDCESSSVPNGTGCDPSYKDAGAPCGADADICSGQDTCDGNGLCEVNDFALGTACGGAAGDCINQDTCDGVGGCTDNGYWSAGASCGAAATECSGQDTCDENGACQANNLVSVPTGYDESCSLAPCPDNAGGAPACDCSAGYSGTLQWDPTTSSWAGACTEINECEGNPCGDGGVCVDLENAYSCQCADGYDGGGENSPCTCAAVDGGWSDWSDWSQCSQGCGQGVEIRTRSCSNPSPNICGTLCDGEDRETRPCDTTCEPGCPEACAQNSTCHDHSGSCGSTDSCGHVHGTSCDAGCADTLCAEGQCGVVDNPCFGTIDCGPCPNAYCDNQFPDGQCNAATESCFCDDCACAWDEECFFNAPDNTWGCFDAYECGDGICTNAWEYCACPAPTYGPGHPGEGQPCVECASDCCQ